MPAAAALFHLPNVCRPAQGVDVASLLGDDVRQQLYRAEVVERLSDGTGNFSAERMLQVGWPCCAVHAVLGMVRSMQRAVRIRMRGQRALASMPVRLPTLLLLLTCRRACHPICPVCPQELPEQLGLDASKAQKVVTELAKDKKHTTLVQVRLPARCTCSPSVWLLFGGMQ